MNFDVIVTISIWYIQTYSTHSHNITHQPFRISTDQKKSISTNRIQHKTSSIRQHTHTQFFPHLHSTTNTLKHEAQPGHNVLGVHAKPTNTACRIRCVCVCVIYEMEAFVVFVRSWWLPVLRISLPYNKEAALTCAQVFNNRSLVCCFQG